MPRWPGLYSLSGLGARGPALAALCAEALAHQITTGQDPAADLMPPDLWAALDPARFLWRRWHALASEACSA
jgi:glycine/D-amino acid oxidase-like deaminating enzyme